MIELTRATKQKISATGVTSVTLPGRCHSCTHTSHKKRPRRSTSVALVTSLSGRFKRINEVQMMRPRGDSNHRMSACSEVCIYIEPKSPDLVGNITKASLPSLTCSPKSSTLNQFFHHSSISFSSCGVFISSSCAIWPPGTWLSTAS